MCLLLGRAFAAGGELADVVEEDRPLQRVELRSVVRDLSQEGIVHEDGGLIPVAIAGIAKEDRDIDLESVCQARKRGQGRHRLAVFDFGDVGAGDIHASRELALREVANVPQITNRRGYLKLSVGGRGGGDEHKGGLAPARALRPPGTSCSGGRWCWLSGTERACSGHSARPRAAQRKPSWLP